MKRKKQLKEKTEEQNEDTTVETVEDGYCFGNYLETDSGCKICMLKNECKKDTKVKNE